MYASLLKLQLMILTAMGEKERTDECKEIIAPDYDKDLIVLLHLPYLVSEGLESSFSLHRLITKTVKYTMCEYFYF